MSRPSWKPGRRHGTHATVSPKMSLVSRSPSTAVAIAMPLSGCRWSTCGARHEAVHRGVDRRRRAALAVAAEVERRDHLVLARLAGIHVDERAQPVEAQHREPGLGQRAEVAARALHPQQLDVAHRSPDRGRRPSPTCCRRRSSCCAGSAPSRFDRASSSATTGCCDAALTRPTRPGCHRRARRRSARRSRSSRYAAIGSAGSPRLGAPLGQVGAHVGVERVHEDAVGREHVAGALGLRQRVAVDEQRARRHLLHVEHRADLARDLRLDVVALVEHERDVAALVVAAAAHDLEQDAEQLERDPPRRR